MSVYGIMPIQTDYMAHFFPLSRYKSFFCSGTYLLLFQEGFDLCLFLMGFGVHTFKRLGLEWFHFMGFVSLGSKRGFNCFDCACSVYFSCVVILLRYILFRFLACCCLSWVSFLGLLEDQLGTLFSFSFLALHKDDARTGVFTFWGFTGISR